MTEDSMDAQGGEAKAEMGRRKGAVYTSCFQISCGGRNSLSAKVGEIKIWGLKNTIKKFIFLLTILC